MSAIIGITLAALCFGLFTLLRPRDRSGACTGGCVGCTGKGHCATTGEVTTAETNGAKP